MIVLNSARKAVTDAIYITTRLIAAFAFQLSLIK